MYEKFYSPNILATASSLVGEDSLSVSIIKHYKNLFYKNLFKDILLILIAHIKGGTL